MIDFEQMKNVAYRKELNKQTATEISYIIGYFNRNELSLEEKIICVQEHLETLKEINTEVKMVSKILESYKDLK